MKNRKIYIVEDVAINRLMLESILVESNYSVCGGATNADKAIEDIQKLNPDLVLLDIHLQGEKTGIDIGKYINVNLKIPFIYLTAYHDQYTVDEIVETHPLGFLIKPINKLQLIATINIALGINKSNDIDSVTLADGNRYIVLETNSIVYLQSEGNYVHIYGDNTHFLIRNKLSTISEQLPPNKFIRIHSRTLINIEKPFVFNGNAILMNKNELPISQTYKKELQDALIRKS